MARRFGRRREVGDQQQFGVLAPEYTILGTGEPPLFSDLNINIQDGGAGGGAGGGGGGLPDIFPPPPTDRPSGMPAYPSIGRSLFWEFVPDSVAGQNWRWTNDYAFPVWVRHVWFTLTTSATIGNRFPIITFWNAGNARIAAFPSLTSRPASTTTFIQFNAQQTLGAQVADNYFGTPVTNISWRGIPLPLVVVPVGMAVGSEFFASGADNNPLGGDVMQGIAILLERVD